MKLNSKGFSSINFIAGAGCVLASCRMVVLDCARNLACDWSGRGSAGALRAFVRSHRAAAARCVRSLDCICVVAPDATSTSIAASHLDAQRDQCGGNSSRSTGCRLGRRRACSVDFYSRAAVGRAARQRASLCAQFGGRRRNFFVVLARYWLLICTILFVVSEICLMLNAFSDFR